MPLFFGVLTYLNSDRTVLPVYETIPYLLIVLAILAINYFVLPWIRARRRSGWDEPTAIRLTAQGIGTRHPNQDSRFYWAKVREVTVKAHRLFLFTSASCAIIVPRRVFQSDEEFEGFVAEASAHWKEHHTA
jgi:hypothetical protein